MAYPYWAGLLAAQWGPLIMASAFFPLLLPATMAKPQTGIPVALTHLTRRGVVACVLVLLDLLSPGCRTGWRCGWDNWGAINISTRCWFFPDRLLLLALFRYRDPDAVLFLLTALLPQRWFFDTLILWLIPKTRKRDSMDGVLSWGAGLWRWYHIPHSFAEVGRIVVCFIYLPMLAVLLLRQFSARREDDQAQTERARKKTSSTMAISRSWR